MTAPRTRLDEGATDFERDLLRSWKNEEPSAQARKNVIGIGVAGALAGTTSTATATGAAGTAIVEGLAPKATAVAVFAIGKWIAAGAIVISGVVVALPYVRSQASTPAPVALRSMSTPSLEVQAAPREPANEVAAPNEALPDPVPEAKPAPTTQATAIARAAPARAASRPAHSAVEPVTAAPTPSDAPEEKHSTRGLGEQVVSLDRAESALAAGDVTEALRLVDDYETRFPAGSLLQEAMALRIEALFKQGKQDEATALADRFLAAHPTSPYAAKLRRRLESGSIR